VKGGGTERFNTCVCSVVREGKKFFLFQLFRDPAPATGGGAGVHHSTAAAQRKVEGCDTAFRMLGSSVETSTAQKQKLDCALQLARTVALDFNNALTTILGHASLVLSKMEPSHPWRNSLSEVEKAAQRGAEIAQDLAAFSRQEQDAQARTTSNLNDLVRCAVDVFQRPNLSHILWTVQLEKQPYTVRLDEAKMQRAFIKILENAVEAVGRDGRITVHTDNRNLDTPVKSGAVQIAAGSYVCVEIADNGCGIPFDVLPHVFEPFFTTKPGPEHRGLGLAWVYGIVTNHGGTVSVSSLPNQGTTVRVFLPAQKKILKDRPTRVEDLRGDQTLLVVDDDEMVLSLSEMILTSAGYKVWAAANGQRALELFSHAPSRFDLVITDLAMPGMSGRELIERLRRVSPGVAVLCTSGFVRRPVESDENFLAKPYTNHELLRKVKQVLSRAEAS